MNPSVSMTAAAVSLSLVAAAWDARTGRIPNWLTLPALGGALTVQTALGGLFAFGAALAGVIACSAVPLLVYRVSRGLGIGGGDIKLFAALGALLGPTLGLEVELGAFVVLSAFAIAKLAFRGQLVALLSNAAKLLFGTLLPARFRARTSDTALTEMRLGPAIAVACLCSAFHSQVSEVLPWLG